MAPPPWLSAWRPQAMSPASWPPPAPTPRPARAAPSRPWPTGLRARRAELGGWLADTVYSDRARKPFAELPSTPGADARASGAVARERLEAGGLEPLYVDLSPPDRAIAVVKVITPGLEVETMSYHRIGERNARKLIERDHPLIRFGEPSATLRPVRLTPDALDRFGGQPLFDTALADAIVGPLYPLYREPEAHHVAARARSTVAA